MIRGNGKFSLNPSIRIYLLLFELMLLGGAFRLYPLLRSDFPLNDGGLFFTMTEDLITNHFMIPINTSYNHGDIPFGYPPLPFYLAAGISTVTNIDLFTIFRYLPLFFSILAIPAFYALSRELLTNESQSIYATLAFTAASPSFEWLIMGGGLTRAPAYFFSILAVKYGLRLLKTRQWKALLLTSVFIGLVGWCHLEILWTTVSLLLVATFISYRNKNALLSFFTVMIGTGIVMSPYVLAVMAHHGLAPFFSAFGAGEFAWHISIAKLLLYTVTGEYLFTPIAVLGLVGLLYCIYQKEFLLPGWILFSSIFNPRSMERTLIIPIALLVGIGLTKVVIPGIINRFRLNLYDKNRQDNQSAPSLARELMPTRLIVLVVIYMFIRSAMTSQIFIDGLKIRLNSLGISDQRAMKWVLFNTDTESRFLVLTPLSNWGDNEVTEWFPTLSKRESVITVQGTEWLSDHVFTDRQLLYDEMLLCATKDLQCAQDAGEKYQISYSYIYISGYLEQSGVQFPLPIETELRQSLEYSIIYDQDGVVIFSRN